MLLLLHGSLRSGMVLYGPIWFPMVKFVVLSWKPSIKIMVKIRSVIDEMLLFVVVVVVIVVVFVVVVIVVIDPTNLPLKFG